MQLYKYQEQSQLLDVHLESIVQPLAGLIRQQALALRDATPSSLAPFLGVCRLLNVLVIVRGYKTVVKFFPHEASDLETVLNVLTVVRAHVPANQDEGLASWEAQGILLLWLSILILIPFGLATVDTAAALEGAQSRCAMLWPSVWISGRGNHTRSATGINLLNVLHGTSLCRSQLLRPVPITTVFCSSHRTLAWWCGAAPQWQAVHPAGWARDGCVQGLPAPPRCALL